MIFKLSFANNSILSCFVFVFFLSINLHFFLIFADVPRIFNPTAELTIPIGVLTKEANEETETHPIIAETKISHDTMLFKAVKTFLCF